MAGCSCGKREKCNPSRHPNVSSGLKFTQIAPILHMQRRAGETFPELEKRLGLDIEKAPDREIRYEDVAEKVSARKQSAPDT